MIDYDTNSLTVDQLNSIAGSNFTSYVQKWITREIPIRQIYLPEHRLKTGDRVIYNSNQGSSIIVSEDKINSLELSNFDSLYAYVLDSNHIGIFCNLL